VPIKILDTAAYVGRGAPAGPPSPVRRPAAPRTLWRELRQFFLPARCLLCERLSDDAICPGCDAHYWRPAASIPRCPQCAIRVSRPAALCGPCAGKAPAFDRTIALADYAPPLDTIALALKFGGSLRAGRALGQRLGKVATVCLAAAAPAGGPMFVMPVPLSARRLARRGYNQALEIAWPLARALDAPVCARVVARTRETALPPAARRRNTAGAFAVSDRYAALCRGAHIAVVDDVMTTGATLDALARTLKRAGAAHVTNFVAFRTP
jgi:ComF family protein